MSRKIIGATVGTPISMKAIAENIDLPDNPQNLKALTINGKTYDGSEAVTVDTTPFVITVTGDDTAGYTADKTAAELNAAYAANSQMLCVLNGTHVPFVRVTGNPSTIRTYSFQSPLGASYILVVLKVARNKLIVTVSNGNTGGLNPLTINGTAYDGTKAVTVNTSPLYITMTQDESTGEFAADHSFLEALNAYSTGRTLACVFEGFLVPLASYGPDGFTFSTILYLEGYMISVTFMLGSDGAVAFEDQMIETGEFVFTVTGTDADGYTSDVSYEEVRAAYYAGRTVVCVINSDQVMGFRTPLAMVDDSSMAFIASPGAGFGVMVQFTSESIYAGVLLASVKIGDQQWDMDQEVDFTDTINGMIDAKLAAITNAEGVAF